MHDDASNIFNLYLEAVEEQPQMTTDEQGNKQWRLHGVKHRVHGPAIERADGTKAWFLHGKRHRMDGPAIEKADGRKEWWLHGKRHRDGAPAIEGADGVTTWFLHGNLHRDDGPAYENPHTGYKAWYLHNKAYAKPELWAAAVLKERNKPHDDASVDAFLRTILRKDAEAAL